MIITNSVEYLRLGRLLAMVLILITIRQEEKAANSDSLLVPSFQMMTATLEQKWPNDNAGPKLACKIGSIAAQ